MSRNVLKNVDVKNQGVQINSLEIAFREHVEKVERQLQDLINLKHNQVGRQVAIHCNVFY